MAIAGLMIACNESSKKKVEKVQEDAQKVVDTTVKKIDKWIDTAAKNLDKWRDTAVKKIKDITPKLRRSQYPGCPQC